MPNRKSNSLRRVIFETGFTRYAEGSVLIRQGNTHVLCTASVEDNVPPFLRGRGQGWVTAEYAMLPRSTHTRGRREGKSKSPSSRGIEISRLVGRALRAAVDMKALGENSITIDCDVLQADGGTRCASITGGMVALALALKWMQGKKMIESDPLRHWIAAVSVGIVDGKPTLDLDYERDHRAEVDMNVVMTEDGRFVEIQGTAEQEPFTTRQLTALQKLAAKGIGQLVRKQKAAIRR